MANGLLRVGGRLSHSTMDKSFKHPLLIPKGRILARLIIKCCNEKVAHSGEGIRSSGFWKISCNATVRSFILRCITCRHLRGNLQLQKMASLPKDVWRTTFYLLWCWCFWSIWYEKRVQRTEAIWNIAHSPVQPSHSYQSCKLPKHLLLSYVLTKIDWPKRKCQTYQIW